jgi:hypothetical protein
MCLQCQGSVDSGSPGNDVDQWGCGEVYRTVQRLLVFAHVCRFILSMYVLFDCKRSKPTIRIFGLSLSVTHQNLSACQFLKHLYMDIDSSQIYCIGIFRSMKKEENK